MHESKVPSELSAELLGVASTNPFLMHDSSSRLAMACTQIGQALVTEGNTVKRALTGTEREYGRFTFNIKMPCNAIVIRCIRKYPPMMGERMKENPLTILVYEDLDSPTREIGILELTRHHCMHQHFGFKYVYRPVLEQLVPGAHIPKGTVIADSPSITPDGDYKYGIETNIALMSYHPVIEDGIIASDEYLERLKTKAYGSRFISWGERDFPLNLYGDDKVYKPFPDIGEFIRDDKLLFATRRYDEKLAVVDFMPSKVRGDNFTQSNLREVDYIFDNTVYAEANAKVVDIIVHKGGQSRSNLPTGMNEQTEYYYRKEIAFYQSLMEVYEDLKRKRRDTVRISPNFERILVESQAFLDGLGKNRVVKTVGRSPLDEWHVEIVYEYTMTPTIGSKLTDCHGGKGVVVHIMKAEDMPTDADGNRADIIMDDFSTIKRMNLGRLYEQYINAASRDVSKRVRSMLGNRTPEEVEAAWEYLKGYYQIVSPRMWDEIVSSGTDKRKLEHLDAVAADGIYLFVPTDNPERYSDVVRNIQKYYPPVFGPVTYRGQSGRVSVTKKNVLIGSLYMLLLEKMGNTWTAVSSSKLQHFGIPSKHTNTDKYSSPSRNNPVRSLGESEVRLYCSVMSGDAVAELLEQSTDPRSHRAILDNILAAPKPTAISAVIDRSVVPRGKSRALALINHQLECAGVRFRRLDEK